MSHDPYFNIIPFDPLVVPNPKIQLPIDFDDFAQQLQKLQPTGELRINKSNGEVDINLHISTEKYGSHIVAHFIEDFNQFCVSLWPKRLSKEIIFWYRHYIPMNYSLFLVVPEYGDVTELAPNITLDDIEKLYPFPLPEELW